jgi:hypothetical protein
MPYVKQIYRDAFDPDLEKLCLHIQSTGDLTYCIFKLMKMLTEKSGKTFGNMSSILSEVECAKLEFYRRILAPYEDIKIKENGDVV